MNDQSSSLQRPVSRAARLSAIEQTLAANIVTSQSQLSDLLASQGIAVTQATLSRDLDEMNATKVRTPDGTLAYAIDDQIPYDADSADSDARAQQYMTKVLSGLVTSVAAARNLVVIHTSSGAAQYVGSVIDKHAIHHVLGTIAGDDTVLVICQDDETAQQRAQWLLGIASK